MFVDVRKMKSADAEEPLTQWMCAMFTYESQTESGGLIYKCCPLRLRLKMQTIAPPPVITCSSQQVENGVAVECTMMSGNVIMSAEYSKDKIPTYAFIRKAVTQTMLEANLISQQQCIKLILENGDIAPSRAKVWKQNKRKR